MNGSALSVVDVSTSKRRLSVNKAQLMMDLAHQVNSGRSGSTFSSSVEDDRYVDRDSATKVEKLLEKEKHNENVVVDSPWYLEKFLPEIDVKVTALCGCWYVTSSISSNLSKAILSVFSHPVALTELQFIMSGMLCLIFVTLVNLFQKPSLRQTKFSELLCTFPEGILPTYLDGNFNKTILRTFLKPKKLALMTTFPMGIFQFFGHITSHKATYLIPVSLVHSMKALSPIITVSYYRIFQKREYNSMTYYTLLVLVAGVMLTCWSTHGNRKAKKLSNEFTELDWADRLKGLIYASISMIIFVSQNIFAKNILTVKKEVGVLLSSSSSTSLVNLKAKSGLSSSDLKRVVVSPTQIDKLTILFYCSCMGALLTFPPFITEVFLKHDNFIQDISATALILMLIHSISHFIQALLAFQLIGMLSPVNYSVANIMKRIVIIFIALIWESQMNMNQIFGLLMTLAGLYGYDKWGLNKADSRQL